MSTGVLIRPIVTEKTTSQLQGNDVVFEVSLDANKIQIKEAVEQFYGKSVESVRTLVVRGKIKRSGRFQGKRSNWKKAYVRLAAGESIDVNEV